jgi:hypothetical protein
MTTQQTYKGFDYRVLRSSFGTINAVVVFANGKDYRFDTIATAKRFISSMTDLGSSKVHSTIEWLNR